MKLKPTTKKPRKPRKKRKPSSKPAPQFGVWTIPPGAVIKHGGVVDGGEW